MFAHPQSRYFDLGKIDDEQLEDYAHRRNKPIEELRKYLASTLLKNDSQNRYISYINNCAV